MKTCFLFPGQGAQYSGMGKDLWEDNQGVKDLFKKASDQTGMDLEKLIFEGSEEDLKATDKTQIAVTLINLSASLILKEKGLKPQGTAGFSLGEYAALCEAGIISIDDIFPIVKARGSIMEEVSRSLDSPEGNPGMAAVIGLTYDALEKAVKEAGLKEIYLANYNAPTQIVISGTSDGLKNAEDVLKNAGARYIPLKVSGPFHCPLLEKAREEMKEVLEGYTFSNPRIPVYTNVTGGLISSGEEARKFCADQIVSPVRWVVIEENMIKEGYDQFIEVGPGVVLTGLLKRYSRDGSCSPGGKLSEINAIIG